jgi:hypothetical protein
LLQPPPLSDAEHASAAAAASLRRAAIQREFGLLSLRIPDRGETPTAATQRAAVHDDVEKPSAAGDAAATSALTAPDVPQPDQSLRLLEALVDDVHRSRTKTELAQLALRRASGVRFQLLAR